MPPDCTGAVGRITARGARARCPAGLKELGLAMRHLSALGTCPAARGCQAAVGRDRRIARENTAANTHSAAAPNQATS